MKCAIIDDEPLALGLLESYVKKTPMLELCGCYSSAIEAMGGLQKKPVDILFLDIQMPDLDGFRVFANDRYCSYTNYLYHSF